MLHAQVQEADQTFRHHSLVSEHPGALGLDQDNFRYPWSGFLTQVVIRCSTQALTCPACFVHGVAMRINKQVFLTHLRSLPG